MRLADFHYELPPELVAQEPSARRDASRLLVVPPAQGPLEHRSFSELPGVLPPGALVIVNDTRVIPARLHAEKPSGGRVELLLVEREPSETGETWICLLRAKKTLRAGTPLTLVPPAGGSRSPAGPAPVVTFLGRLPDGTARIAVDGPLLPVLDGWGELPLPPYIERAGGVTADDGERYQTVFATDPGAVAAPTAGLHFTPAILGELESRDIQVARVTLHVGPGTFSPVREDDVTRHVMHEERYHVPQATADAHARARAAGRPVVAVGTTVVRTLESAFDDAAGRVRSGPGATRLFAIPGYRFRAVDRLITNFHLPESTLLMLVSAFVGRSRILDVYAEAVRQRYRFFSYGDAMLLTLEQGSAA